MGARAVIKPNQSIRAGALIGIGFVAAIDEIIFHQILGWHHFYDKSTPVVGLISDGLLHSAELIALVAGFYGLYSAHLSQLLRTPLMFAGVLFGMGGFQLFDGIINHKILRLHQIRYDVNLFFYDSLWCLLAILLLLSGYWVKYKYHKNARD
jgi:uncharacterized membrane protein